MSADPLSLHYDDEARTVLLRYLRLAEGTSFQAAAVEVPTPVVRELLMAWLRATLPTPRLIVVSLASLRGQVLAEALPAALAAQGAAPGDVLVLTELEAVVWQDEVAQRLNLERDALVRTLARPWLVLAHPKALVRLRQVAPDFVAFLSTTVRCHFEATDNVPWSPLPESSLRPSAPLSVARPHWPALLRDADDQRAAWAFDQAEDRLAAFEARGEPGWEAEVALLRAWATEMREGAAAALARVATLDPESETMRGETRCELLLARSGWHAHRGEMATAKAEAQRALALSEQLGETAAKADALLALTRWAGSYQEAETMLRQAVALHTSIGRARNALSARLLLAITLLVRGSLDAASDLLQRVVLPECEQLNLLREKAMAKGLVADILLARGEFEEALRIHREEALPVYEQLGDQYAKAVTAGSIADVLRAKGDLDEALRIREQEELPVYRRLGTARDIAVTLGGIADILQVRGNLDEALRIRLEEQLPVYERLGDLREKAVTQGWIAAIYARQGDRARAIQILRTEVLPKLKRIGDQRGIASTQHNLAVYLLAQPANPGRKAEARQLLNQAHRVAQPLKLPLLSAIEVTARRHGIVLSGPRRPPPPKRKARRKR